MDKSSAFECHKSRSNRLRRGSAGSRGTGKNDRRSGVADDAKSGQQNRTGVARPSSTYAGILHDENGEERGTGRVSNSHRSKRSPSGSAARSPGSSDAIKTHPVLSLIWKVMLEPAGRSTFWWGNRSQIGLFSKARAVAAPFLSRSAAMPLFRDHSPRCRSSTASR